MTLVVSGGSLGLSQIADMMYDIPYPNDVDRKGEIELESLETGVS